MSHFFPVAGTIAVGDDVLSLGANTFGQGVRRVAKKVFAGGNVHVTFEDGTVATAPRDAAVDIAPPF
jgi:hypothetical protein